MPKYYKTLPTLTESKPEIEPAVDENARLRTHNDDEILAKLEKLFNSLGDAGDSPLDKSGYTLTIKR